MQKHKGFSLVELMVVVAVIAIIALVAVPSFQGMRDSARVKAAAEAVYSHIQFARSESVKQNRDLFVSVKAGATWCVGISNVAGCDCATVASCQFGPAAALSERNLTSSDFSGITMATTLAELQIDSRRGSTGTTATVTVTGSSSRSAQIGVLPLGRTTICGNVGGMPAC